MNKLYSILTQIKTSLDELEAIMLEEVSQLSRSSINPVSLQVLTDNKSQLLSKIQYYDELRRQQEQISSAAAPYSEQVNLFHCWQQITEKIIRTKDLNQKVESLLHEHMQKNAHRQKVVEQVDQTATLYGSAGVTTQYLSGNKYNISI